MSKFLIAVKTAH